MTTKNAARAAILGAVTTKAKRIVIPEWSELVEGGVIVVRELNVAARTAVLAALKVQVGGGEQSGSINLTAIVPHVTDLILTPESCPVLVEGEPEVDASNGETIFEQADRDNLVKRHPAAVQRVLFTAFSMSEIGAVGVDEGGNDISALDAAVGN